MASGRLMADSADIAAEITADVITDAVRRARAAILPGLSGECEGCDWWMPRLVDGLCGFCRDGRKRPPDWEPLPRPDEPTPEPIREESIMAAAPSKSVTFVATGPLLEELKRLTADGTPYNRAAVALFERAMAAPEPAAEVSDPAPEPARTPRQRMMAALDQVASIAAELLDRPDDQLAVAAAWARVQEAEAKADSLAEALTAANARVADLSDRWERARAAFAA